MAIFHCPVQIIQRSKGKSAVAAAAYRSGEKLVNEWDGLIHDYTHKRGIVHREILLPAHAPPEFADRSTLWNSVEEIEKSSDAQLAREIEVALPVELSPAAQLALVRSYINDNFVAAGMCADFAIHDKGTGNPHAHIMLTMRPLKADGTWGAKCRKVYDLDEHRSRKPLIVTTNIPLHDLQHPQDTAHARIYDRLLGMCAPIRFSGENFRKATAQDKLVRLKNLMD